MNRLNPPYLNIALLIALVFVLSLPATSTFAGGGLSLLGSEPTKGAATSQSINFGEQSFTPTKRKISTIAGPNGIRQADFNLYTQNGQSYIEPNSFGQVFQGSQMTQQGNQYIVQRPDGGQLTFIIVMQQLMIIFLGMQAETGVQVHQQGGQTYLPLNDMGQFYGQQFSQTGSQLVNSPSNQQAPWLQNSWNNTLQQSGALDYRNQISNNYNQRQTNNSSNQRQTNNNSNQQQVNGSAPNGKVMKNITATVFSSSESKQGGAYGEWLRKDDLYVALPKRFSGKRPMVAVQGPSGTYKAEIKDVGPWNINDPYWVTGNRPQAESGFDLGQTRSGRRKTNLAGIDLSYKLGRLVGIGGKGKVNWWFTN